MTLRKQGRKPVSGQTRGRAGGFGDHEGATERKAGERDDHQGVRQARLLGLQAGGGEDRLFPGQVGLPQAGPHRLLRHGDGGRAGRGRLPRGLRDTDGGPDEGQPGTGPLAQAPAAFQGAEAAAGPAHQRRGGGGRRGVVGGGPLSGRHTPGKRRMAFDILPTPLLSCLHLMLRHKLRQASRTGSPFSRG